MSRLHEGIMRVLIDDVVRGRLRPGALLPREADSAARCGLSRGVARECVRGLDERGIGERRRTAAASGGRDAR